MDEEQKRQAVALRRIHAVFRWSESARMPREWVEDKGAMVPVLNLADTTGTVEGVLHRVLEGMVGEPVEVQAIGDKPEWRARCARASLAKWPTNDRYPTRLEAIAAALLAMVAPNADVCADGARSHTATGATT